MIARQLEMKFFEWNIVVIKVDSIIKMLNIIDFMWMFYVKYIDVRVMNHKKIFGMCLPSQPLFIVEYYLGRKKEKKTHGSLDAWLW